MAVAAAAQPSDGDDGGGLRDDEDGEEGIRMMKTGLWDGGW